MQGCREKCLESGMNDYIINPVTPAALSELLEKWLARLDTANKFDEFLGYEK